jgi:GNAT superfamily N-acetyltransferase
MADLTVTRVTPFDREAWLHLWSQWQSHMNGSVPDSISEASWQSFLDDASGLDCFLARNQEGPALGFATISRTPFAWTASQVLFLQDLFVTEAARGSGVGARLLRAVYDHADHTGATQVFWLVDENDRELQAFYTRHAIRTPYLRYMRSPWPW